MRCVMCSFYIHSVFLNPCHIKIQIIYTPIYTLIQKYIHIGEITLKRKIIPSKLYMKFKKMSNADWTECLCLSS